MRRLTHPLGNGTGGKSAGLQTLAELAQRGVFKEILEGMSKSSRYRGASERIIVSVPEGMVLTSGHFESYVRIPSVSEAAASRSYARTMGEIARNPIRDERTLEAALEAAESLEGPVAVRSSASCEDSGRKSPFAGNFMTAFLHLKEGMPKEEKALMLLGAVREVYASFFAEGVQRKMHSLGISPSEHYMAVVLQKVMGRKQTVEMDGGTRELHMPFASAVLASRSIGIQRPAGVGRDSAFLRMGFGLGTLVVAGDGEEPVPCTIIFPERPGIVDAPTSISMPEGRGHTYLDSQIMDFLKTQDRFDALDLGKGRVERIGIEDVRDEIFFRRNDGAITSLENGEFGWNIRPGWGRVDNMRNVSLRATFQKFIGSPDGLLFAEFAGRLAKRLAHECGFEVDMELVLMPGREKFEIGLVQLRPFGTKGERVMLSEVSEERIIARTEDCIGNGRHEMDAVVVVTREAQGAAAPDAQAEIGKINREMPGRYALLGPNVTKEMGIGGAYGEAHNPGLVISYGAEDSRMAAAGTHMFNNIAMMRVIEAPEEELGPKVERLLEGAERLCSGVYLVRGKFVAELDGTSGHAQAYRVVE